MCFGCRITGDEGQEQQARYGEIINLSLSISAPPTAPEEPTEVPVTRAATIVRPITDAVFILAFLFNSLFTLSPKDEASVVKRECFLQEIQLL